MIKTLLLILVFFVSSSFADIRAPRSLPKPPKKWETSAPVKPLIVLDPGHGGNDEGAKVPALMEKRATLSTAYMAKRQLEDMGYRVILTRSRDVFIPLARRAMIANKNEGELFVSIHFNAARNPCAKGIEVFYYNEDKSERTKESKQLANCILYHLLDQTEATSRGVKKGNHHVTRETQMPAVMVEGGFITNPEEGTLLKDRAYLSKIAEGIAEGVDKFMRSYKR